MANPYFQFKQFTIYQDRCAMKVCTDAALFGAWVAEQIKCIDRKKGRLLDIGAGTGLLSLMVAQKNLITADLVEINREAAIQCSENVSGSPWSGYMTVHQVNIIDFKPTLPYNIIISNPPFYEYDLRSDNTDKNIAHHSEHFSLDALLFYIQEMLVPDGIFFLLFPFKRLKELEVKMNRKGLYINDIIHVRQTVHQPPFRVMVKGSINKGEIITGDLFIQDEKKEYTAAFIHLLKDYYLYL